MICLFNRRESVGVIMTLEKSRIKAFRKLFRNTKDQEFSFRLIERKEVAVIQVETILIVVLR